MRIVSYLFIIFISFTVHSQPSTLSPLSIGDKMPSLVISNVSNYQSNAINFADLKGKMVILDFWGINCSPCLKAFPKLETLQSRFSDKLQIVMVNTASKEWIDSVAKKRRETNHRFRLSSLPSVTEDSLLHYLFPHKSIPHYVWISPSGFVSAITEGEAINDVNIEKFIRNERISLPQKKELLGLNRELPLSPQLFKENLGGTKYYSVLTNFVDGLSGSTTWYDMDTLDKTVRITRGNYRILDLCVEALFKRLESNPYESAAFDYGKRVILEVRDSSKYLFDSSLMKDYKEWRNKNSYCYELILPVTQFANRYQYYLNDLRRYFGLEAKLEKRKVTCHAIVRTSELDKIKYTGSSGPIASWTDSLGVFRSTGVGKGLYFFRNKLAEVYKYQPHIFIDQTGYTGKVDLAINAPLENLERVRKELTRKYDLDIIEVESEVEVMILTEMEEEKTNE